MSTNQSLSRGLALLDAVNHSAQPIGIREAARMLDISPSIAQRLVNTLVEAGYLQQVAETRKYQLGAHALALGSKMARTDPLYTSASQQLGVLAQQHYLNGYLGVVQQNAVVYLHTVQSAGAIAIRAEVGQRICPHATALGKALLAGLSPDEVSRILGPAPYVARTARTITTAEALRKELELTSQRGYSLADEENDIGVVSIGAPIRNKSGLVVAAISVAFLKLQRSPDEWPQIAELVKRAGEKCSNALGYVSNAHDPAHAIDVSLGS